MTCREADQGLQSASCKGKGKGSQISLIRVIYNADKLFVKFQKRASDWWLVTCRGEAKCDLGINWICILQGQGLTDQPNPRGNASLTSGASTRLHLVNGVQQCCSHSLNAVNAMINFVLEPCT